VRSRDNGLRLSQVLRLIGAGDVLSRPSVSNASPLFEGPVSLVDSFCRGLRLVLAVLRPLNRARCGLRHLPCLAELACGRVLGHYTKCRELVGDWDGWPSHQLILVCIPGPLPGRLRVAGNLGRGRWSCFLGWSPSPLWGGSRRGHDII
jgi:hypothetical protein